MATLEALQNRIQSVTDLMSVVKTMKAMAAVSIRQYEKAVESAQLYYHTIELGFQALSRKSGRLVRLIRERQHTEQTVALIIGSDQGMCGQFNERAFDLLEKNREEMEENIGKIELLVIGVKMYSIVADSDFDLLRSFPAPASVETISNSIENILSMLEKLRKERGFINLRLFYNRKSSGSSYQPVSQRLLPITASWLEELSDRKWPDKVIPNYRIATDNLLSALVRQYMFSGLYRALAESLAGENASRLAAMQAAEKNIEEQLDRLTSEYHHERQESITSELLDMVAGYEALTGDEDEEEEDDE